MAERCPSRQLDREEIEGALLQRGACRERGGRVIAAQADGIAGQTGKVSQHRAKAGHWLADVAHVAALRRAAGETSAGATGKARCVAVAGIEEANERAAQFLLTHRAARHFILSVQRAHRGQPNFSRQPDVLDEIVDKTAEQRLPRMPVDRLRSIVGVPFAIRYRLPDTRSCLMLLVPCSGRRRSRRA